MTVESVLQCMMSRASYKTKSLLANLANVRNSFGQCATFTSSEIHQDQTSDLDL